MNHEFNIGKDLQQQNFKEILQKMMNVSGWEILEENNLLALKSPVLTPLVNMVWGGVTESNLSKVMNFYANNEFYWLLSEEQTANVPDNLKEFFMQQDEQSVFPEMVFDIQNYVNPSTLSSNINVIIPRVDSELQIWTETAIATLEINEYDWKDFFYPLIDVAKCVPLLSFYDDEPAGTAMVYCGDLVAGIYAMSTKEKFRRKGIGSASVDACIEIAKTKGIRQVVLYASTIGSYLYTTKGFKTTQKLYEFHFNKK